MGFKTHFIITFNEEMVKKDKILKAIPNSITTRSQGNVVVEGANAYLRGTNSAQVWGAYGTTIDSGGKTNIKGSGIDLLAYASPISIKTTGELSLEGQVVINGQPYTPANWISRIEQLEAKVEELQSKLNRKVGRPKKNGEIS